MLTYDLTKNIRDIKKPLYVQLYDNIKNDILKENLNPNEKLPSKRALAKHLGISIITVENSYDQLISEGFIYSLPRKGFFVTPLPPDMLKYKELSTKTLKKSESSETNSNYNNKQNFTSDKQQFINLSSNQTLPESFPFSIWAKLTRNVLSERQRDLLINPPSQGIKELRENICQYLKNFKGLDVSSENIVIGAGTEYIYSLIIQLLGFDKIYAVENPGYLKLSYILDSFQVKHISVPIDDQGVCVQSLEKENVDIIHITPSHHFPTGITMPVARRYELLQWAGKNSDSYIVEDDYDSEFRMTGLPIPSIFSSDTAEKVIYINTFSKAIAPTIRVSYMILPSHLMQIYNKMFFHHSCSVSTFEQYTLSAFIGEGYFEKHLNRMRNYYKKKRDLLLNHIAASPLHKISQISEKDSGLHFLLNISLKCSETIYKDRLSKDGIYISSLSDYMHNPQSPSSSKNQFLINYSSLPDEMIPEVVEKLYLHSK